MGNRKGWILPTVLSLALVLAIAWGYNQYTFKNEYGIAMTNNYQRLFSDTKKHIENVQVSLSKALVSESRDQNILLLSRIMNEAFFAQDKLAQLPLDQADIANTQKFLNQVADYSYKLIEDHLEGKKITSKQRETLFNLQNNSALFNRELASLQDEILNTQFSAKKLTSRQREKMDKANQQMYQTRMVNLEKQMAKNPELIYDGPYSDQVLNKKPLGLGTNKVTEAQAEKIARDFIGTKKVAKVTPFEAGENMSTAKIPAYTFSVVPENTPKEMAIYIAVSRTGGKVIWMANPRPVSKVNISVNQAEKKAIKFLEEKGYADMEANYSLRNDGAILFNFALKQENTTIYPDLVKVKVALDNGEIVGFDASTYLVNHHDRNIPEPQITEQKARESIRLEFDIESIRLAVIPKGAGEVLCYEFKGKYKGSDYIIYINASNGKEEQILQLIKNENGTLTL